MCKHPKKAFVCKNSFTDNGKQQYKVCSYDTTFIYYSNSNRVWKPSKEPITYDIEPLDCFSTTYVEIPCGKCIECRLNRAKEWALRCTLEAKRYQYNYFITFTYDEEHVPYSRTDEGDYMTLVKKDLQDLFKRMRSRGLQFRYFACGEYGSKTYRPHYHVCFFGLEIPDLTFYKNSHLGDTYYNSELLNDVWGKGYVVIAPMTYETCGYTARYTLKKTKEDNAEIKDRLMRFGIQDEFIVMSRKPGIGLDYYLENKDSIYSDDRIYCKTVKGIRECKPPRYFDRYYAEEEPELMQKIKDQRRLTAELRQANKDRATSLPRLERLKVEEKQLFAKAERLVRNDI